MTKHSPFCPSRYKIGLAISVVVNLFLVSLIGAHVVRANLRPHFPNALAEALANAEQSLSSKDAATFKRVFVSEALEFNSATERLDDARYALGRQILAQPYNPDAVRASLETWRANWNAFFDSFEGPLVDSLGAISQDGRRKIVADRQARQKSMGH